MNVYLAGKVGGRKWEVVKPLSNVEWVASDGSNHSEHLWGTGGFIPWDKIGQESLTWGGDDAIKQIIVADCLVAYLDTHDCYGTIVELTLAVGASSLDAVILTAQDLHRVGEVEKALDYLHEIAIQYPEWGARLQATAEDLRGSP